MNTTTFFLPFIFLALQLSAFAQVSGLQEINTTSKNVRGLVITPDGSSLFLTDGESILQYSLKTNALVGSPYNAHRDVILSLAITDDGRWLVSAGRDSTVLVWDIETRTIIQRLTHHRGVLTSVVVSNDKSTIASVETNSKIIVYDVIRQKISFEISPGGEVAARAMSPDGQILATRGESKNVLI